MVCLFIQLFSSMFMQHCKSHSQLICLFLVTANIIICVSEKKNIRRRVKLFRGTELINCKPGERDTLQN